MTKAHVNAELLESIMILKGFKSRKAFAEALGSTPLTISNLLNGVHNPSHDLMNAIYKALELTPDQGIAIFFDSDLRNTKD